MSRLIPMSDLVADDLLLDRLAAREPAGADPVAGLLATLADQADTPLPSRAGRRRTSHKHRYLGPFVALVVAGSGAGVAAAVTQPHHAPGAAEKARIARQMDAAARSDAPSALLSRLGLPRTTGTTVTQGLVMARRDDGAIVLVPASLTNRGVVTGTAGRADGSGPGAAHDGAGTQGGATGQNGGGQGAGHTGATGGHDESAAIGSTQDGTGTNGSGQAGSTGTGSGQGGDEQGSGAPGTTAGASTGSLQPHSTGEKQGTGGKGSGVQGKPGGGSTGSASGSTGTTGTTGKGGRVSPTGSTPTLAPTAATPSAAPSAATSPSALTLLPVLGPNTMLVSTVSPQPR